MEKKGKDKKAFTGPIYTGWLSSGVCGFSRLESNVSFSFFLEGRGRRGSIRP